MLAKQTSGMGLIVGIDSLWGFNPVRDFVLKPTLSYLFNMPLHAARGAVQGHELLVG